MAGISKSQNPTASSSGDNSPPKKKTKVWYSQSFNSEWLNDPEFKDWIKPDPNDKYIVHCIVCDSKLKNPNKGGLRYIESCSKLEVTTRPMYREKVEESDEVLEKAPLQVYM